MVAELIEEARTVRGKTGILFKVASAVTEQPDGVVRQVIFPVVDERTFQALAKEAIAAGTAPARRVHTAVRASYGSYYRRMMPKLGHGDDSSHGGTQGRATARGGSPDGGHLGWCDF